MAVSFKIILFTTIWAVGDWEITGVCFVG